MPDTKYAVHTIAKFCRTNAKARVKRPMSTGEVALLLYIENEETVHTSVEAAAYFKVSKPAVSRTVAALEEKGLVTRERSLSDARVSELFLTDKGREAANEISDEFECMARTLRSRIGSDEFDRFIEIMDEANSIIEEIEG